MGDNLKSNGRAAKVQSARASESMTQDSLARRTLAVSPPADRQGVIGFQHRRKISSILIRNTLVPLAIRTAPGSCLGIEGVKSPNTRSRYEYRPPGLAKKVRTAVGRQICAAGARTLVPKERA